MKNKTRWMLLGSLLLIAGWLIFSRPGDGKNWVMVENLDFRAEHLIPPESILMTRKEMDRDYEAAIPTLEQYLGEIIIVTNAGGKFLIAGREIKEGPSHDWATNDFAFDEYQMAEQRVREIRLRLAVQYEILRALYEAVDKINQ